MAEFERHSEELSKESYSYNRFFLPRHFAAFMMVATLIGDLMRTLCSWLWLCFVLFVASSTAHAQTSVSASACASGTALRNAYHGDPVCIPFAERQRVADDNAQAAQRISPGPYGPKQCKNGYKWRLARPDDLVCVSVSEFNIVQQQNALASSRYAINGGVDMSRVPEAQRPGDHTMELRVSRARSNSSKFSHTGYVFIGIFNHGSLNCEHGSNHAVMNQGSGASLTMLAGWGQVMGTGHPDGGKDPCVAWVDQAAVDFDYTPYTSLPVQKTLTYAGLSYYEREAPSCLTMVYTQGGIFVDPMRCWTNGRGDPYAKAEGCIILTNPSEDWVAHPPPGPLQTLPQNFKRMPRSNTWDVTDLVNYRTNPNSRPLGYNSAGLGHGFMLVGTPILVRRLESHDNTRCTSQFEDIKLTLRYNVSTPSRNSQTFPK